MCHHKLYWLWMTIILIDDLLVAIFSIFRSFYFSAAAVGLHSIMFTLFYGLFICFIEIFAGKLECWLVQSIIIHIINAVRPVFVWFFLNGKRKSDSDERWRLQIKLMKISSLDTLTVFFIRRFAIWYRIQVLWICMVISSVVLCFLLFMS